MHKRSGHTSRANITKKKKNKKKLAERKLNTWPKVNAIDRQRIEKNWNNIDVNVAVCGRTTTDQQRQTGTGRETREFLVNALQTRTHSMQSDRFRCDLKQKRSKSDCNKEIKKQKTQFESIATRFSSSFSFVGCTRFVLVSIVASWHLRNGRDENKRHKETKIWKHVYRQCRLCTMNWLNETNECCIIILCDDASDLCATCQQCCCCVQCRFAHSKTSRQCTTYSIMTNNFMNVKQHKCSTHVHTAQCTLVYRPTLVMIQMKRHSISFEKDELCDSKRTNITK